LKIEEKTAYYIRIRSLVDNLINRHRNTVKKSM